MKSFIKIASIDRIVNQLQDNISNAFEFLLKDLFFEQVQIKQIKLTAGQDNIVNHKLGRQLIGWLTTRKRGEADIWDLQDTNTMPHLTLILRTSQDVVVDLRVY